MNSTGIIQVRHPRLLDVSVYVVVIIMAGLGLLLFPDMLTKTAAIALCVAFGLVHAFGFRNLKSPGSYSLYFIVQAVITLALLRLSNPSDVFNLLFYILGLEAVMVFPIRVAAAWITAFYLVDTLSALGSRGAMGFINALFYAAAFLLTAAFGYALRQADIARQENQRLLEELRASQRQLQELAVIEERNRLAREMHDSLGHRLTVAVVQLEGAQRLVPTQPDRAAQMIGAMRDEMKEALAELRQTVTALRGPLSGEAPLDVALTTLTQTFQSKTGIATHFMVSSEFPALPDLYRLTFYRAAQEGLTNIQRHASAGNAWLQLSADDRMVTLVMEDDGKGFDDHQENTPGSGLLGLRERASQLGGQLFVTERPGGGAQLTLSAPLPGGGGLS